MERAKHELDDGDATIAILLSTIAVEGEMAYLFFKWKSIDAGILPISSVDRATWETEWADMRTISKRLEELSRMLTNHDFDHFAEQNIKLLSPALGGFDRATSVKRFFQDQLFEKRNRIVHYGDIDSETLSARQCFSLSLALIALFKTMDKERIKAMDAAHRKANSTNH